MSKGAKYYARWLIVILLMAVGIGTFATLSIRNEKAKEESEANLSSYLTNQRHHDINLQELKKMAASYEAEDVGWEISVYEEYDGKGPYLAGHEKNDADVGFGGRIMYLKDGIVIVELDKDLYRKMPSDWKTEGEGKYAILDYSFTDNGIELGYRGSTIIFDVII